MYIQMNLIKIITYLFVFKNHKYQNNLGNDERFPINEDKISIHKFIENYMPRAFMPEQLKELALVEKKILLNHLISDNISVHDKINKINNFYGNSPKPINILNGGLLDDWSFNF